MEFTVNQKALARELSFARSVVEKGSTIPVLGTGMAISADESRFTLNGALVFASGGALAMVATDGHRLAYMKATPHQSADVDQRYRALVAKKALTELARLAASDGDVELGQDANHLFFKTGDRELTARKLTGSFPDYERVLPQEARYHVRLHKEEIRSALERALQFSDGRSRAVRLQFTKGEMRVYSSLPELGESEEGVPVEYAGADFDIGFNGGYLMDFLRAAPTSHVTLQLKDVQSAGELRPDASFPGEYRYVVMPMRVA